MVGTAVAKASFVSGKGPLVFDRTKRHASDHMGLHPVSLIARSCSQNVCPPWIAQSAHLSAVGNIKKPHRFFHQRHDLRFGLVVFGIKIVPIDIPAPWPPSRHTHSRLQRARSLRRTSASPA